MTGNSAKNDTLRVPSVVQVQDAFLQENKIKKGVMTLTDLDSQVKLLDQLSSKQAPAAQRRLCGQHCLMFFLS